jgi:hypothetical protein
MLNNKQLIVFLATDESHDTHYAIATSYAEAATTVAYNNFQQRSHYESDTVAPEDSYDKLRAVEGAYLVQGNPENPQLFKAAIDKRGLCYVKAKDMAAAEKALLAFANKHNVNPPSTVANIRYIEQTEHPVLWEGHYKSIRREEKRVAKAAEKEALAEAAAKKEHDEKALANQRVVEARRAKRKAKTKMEPVAVPDSEIDPWTKGGFTLRITNWSQRQIADLELRLAQLLTTTADAIVASYNSNDTFDKTEALEYLYFVKWNSLCLELGFTKRSAADPDTDSVEVSVDGLAHHHVVVLITDEETQDRIRPLRIRSTLKRMPSVVDIGGLSSVAARVGIKSILRRRSSSAEDEARGAVRSGGRSGFGRGSF